jgi:hypothetical protein
MLLYPADRIKPKSQGSNVEGIIIVVLVHFTQKADGTEKSNVTILRTPQNNHQPLPPLPE